MLPMVAQSPEYRRILMQPRPGGGVSCFAYKSAGPLHLSAHRFYDTRTGAEQGCFEEWGVSPEDWRTEPVRKVEAAVKVGIACICMFGGLVMLVAYADRHQWNGLSLGFSGAGLLWFARLSWWRPLEGGAVYVAAACVVIALGMIGLGLDQRPPLGLVLDGLSLVTAMALAVAAIASLSSTALNWSRRRRKLRTRSNALQRASSGV